MEINEVEPAVDKADGDVEEPDSNEKCKPSSQDEILPDSTNDQIREEKKIMKMIIVQAN